MLPRPRMMFEYQGTSAMKKRKSPAKARRPRRVKTKPA